MPGGTSSTARRWTHPFARRRTERQARILADYHAQTTARARQAQIDLVRAGYHLGPAPYGYRPLHLPVVDEDGTIRRRTCLAVDPTTAGTIMAIFQLRVTGQLAPAAIARRLADEPGWYPAPTDPTTGDRRPWSAHLVGRILANPVYTGATVWGRTAGGRPMPPDTWVICSYAHEPIIDGRMFFRAQLLAPPGTGVITPALPPWEFPGAAGHDEGSDTGRGWAA
uniref:recombinase family protein n=1 Tax=Frankia sp. Cr1 TaxID=3073931 RepID=UPI002AD2FEAA